MKALKHLVIAASLFASCTFFYSCNNSEKFEAPPTKPARVLTEEQQQIRVKKVYNSKVWGAFSEKGASSVQKYKELHDKSVDEKGYGIFYGSSSRYVDYMMTFGVTPYQSILMEKMLSDDDFISAHLNESGVDDLERTALKKVFGEKPPAGFKAPRSTDCLEWCLLNMRNAYNHANMGEDWKSIIETAVKNSNDALTSKNYGFKGVVGTELAKVLVDEGWIALYYNPDVVTPSDKPAVILPKEEVKKLDLRFLWFDYFVGWTEHVESYRIVKEKKSYYNIPVADVVLNYNPTMELKDIRFSDIGSEPIPIKSPTVKETDKVKKLKQIPFGLLLARGGQHSAMISYGKVYEVHRAAGPIAKSLIEVKDFETEWNWLSGVIMVPPGSWQR